MNTYLVALGSNIGDREYYIEQAIEAIRRNCGEVLKVAPLMETEPLGAADQSFLNTALLCASALEPEAMLQALLGIEEALGRKRTVRWGNRSIDCDIILWQTGDGRFPSYQSENLKIPHPEAAYRSFVLEPAVAIAPYWIHADQACSLSELLERLQNKA